MDNTMKSFYEGVVFKLF